MFNHFAGVKPFSIFQEISHKEYPMFPRVFCLLFLSFMTALPSGAANRVAAPLPRVGRVLVIANASDPASLELAQMYMRGRHLPPANLLRLAFSDPINISAKDFQTGLLEPLRERLDRLGDHVDYLVFMRGVPYRVAGKISLPTAAIYQSATNIRPVNPYYHGETPFASATFPGEIPFRLATMITGYTFDDTEGLIKASLVRYPSAAAAGTFYLCEGVGPRGMRAPQIDEALALLPDYQARGQRVRGADVRNRMDILGQFTGATHLILDGNRYLPGSIVDNVTSFGGCLLDPRGQMSILSFIEKGACGAYGTVSEPTNTLLRWADLSLPVRYASGFNLAESYYQTVADWRFGVLVGDPLMAPFAHPVDVTMTLEKQTIQAGEKAAMHVVLEEGEKGGGVGKAAFWLDDQIDIFDWQPTLPVGSQCELKIQAGEHVLTEKRLTVVKQPETLTNVLGAFAGNVGKVGKIVRRGIRGDQLTLLMMPLIGPDGKRVPVTYEFTVKNSGEEAVTKGTLAQRVVMAEAMVLDFGDSPPRPGDKVTIKIGGQARSAQAFSSSSMEDVVKKLVNYLAMLPEFAPTGDFVLNIRKSPVDPPRYQIVAFPKKNTKEKRFPVSVSVRRAPGSMFARGLETGKHYWKAIPVAAFSQINLTPKLPIAKAAFTLDIPPDQLCPGAHRVTCVTTSSTGAKTLSTVDLMVIPPETERFTAQMPTTIYSIGQTLMITMSQAPAMEKSWPQLVVDDRVVCTWNPGTVIGQFVVDGKLICPGEHQAWIEWSKGKEIPGVTEIRAPLARSSATRMFVRRPLASGVRLSPELVKAGTNSVLLTGPYLKKTIQVMTTREGLPFSRNPRDPRQWSVDVSRLLPGVYQLTLMGDPRTDQSTVISTPLVIQ